MAFTNGVPGRRVFAVALPYVGFGDHGAERAVWAPWLGSGATPWFSDDLDVARAAAHEGLQTAHAAREDAVRAGAATVRGDKTFADAVRVGGVLKVGDQQYRVVVVDQIEIQ